jgi:hypothetical protein
MRKLAAKLMLQNLTKEQNDRCLILCIDFLEQLRKDNILDRVITGDETWYYQQDPEVKGQSMEWRLKNSSRSNKP